MRALAGLLALAAVAVAQPVLNSGPLLEKARYLQRDLIEKHFEDGLYVSIVPVLPSGQKLQHSIDEPGNVIHAGVWTGRYLAGVAYQYAMTHDPWVRRHGGEILAALRLEQEVTGKPGLLARGYVKGHGPVEGFERGGDSRKWHQGQGRFSNYRFYSDVSVDNFNAVLYGYALYYDLAADATQKKIIAYDVDRLMTHLLDNQYRIIDVDGNVTQWGHVGMDPDPARDAYYEKFYAKDRALYTAGPEWRPSLRASLMVLPDLLIANHITGKAKYRDEYRKVVERFRANPEPSRNTKPSLEALAAVDHSEEGQDYEALFNLIRYENDPQLLAIYGRWVDDLWKMNWMEGNSLYTFMTLALLPQKWEPATPGSTPPISGPALAHYKESLELAVNTLRRYKVDRVLHPVMNSIREEIAQNPFLDDDRQKQAAKPLPIDQRPLDNEYAWKGNPYQLDGWLKPRVTAIQYSCDDPLVMWFSDARGKAYMTRDGMKTWQNVSAGLLGAHVTNLAASPERTYVLYAETDHGLHMTRDGGMSWEVAKDNPPMPVYETDKWQRIANVDLQMDEQHRLRRRTKDGVESSGMNGWRIPLATWMIPTPQGMMAGGPGGAYLTTDGNIWMEVKLWQELETGAADYLHAYWMGRYYGFVGKS